MKARVPLFSLLWVFLQIGLFTFGGGYAMIPLIQRIVVDEKHWLTHEEMLEIIIVAESTPGPVALNVATFVGYRQRRLPGSLFATIGVVIPSFVIIGLIAWFFEDIKGNAIIAGALSGIKTAVVVLVSSALMKLYKLLPQDRITLWIIVALTLVMVTLDYFSIAVSGIFFIMAGGLAGYSLTAIRRYVKKRDSKS
jgi:chromate transporter